MTPAQPCRMCGTPVVPGDRFCASCGTPVVACGTCAELLLPGDRFCPKCGATAPGTSVGTPSGGVPSPWQQVRERLAAAAAGEFEIIRELGRGGMAAVYLAREQALNRQVAIKVMAPGLMLGEGMVERFRQEAVTVANLNHPNIITIHAVRQFEDLHYFVMQYVDGRALDEVLTKTGPLPHEVVRAILAQVGSGLAYAHRRGVIHRDIKPANILLDSDGNAIVMDFGIAKVAEVPGQTKTGTMVGTPAYMSPEQCAGEAITWSSDLYSLGIVAFELLTGIPPFSGSNYAIMKGHLETPVPSVRQSRPDCTEELERCVQRMMGKTPDDRFASMAEAIRAVGTTPLLEDGPVRTQLQQLGGGPHKAAPPPIQPPPARAPATTPPAAPPTVRRSIPIVVRNQVVLDGVPDRIEEGDAFRVSAIVRSPEGDVVPDQSVIWATSDPAVIQVRDDGHVVAAGSGEAELTARAGSAHVTEVLRVRRPSAISLELPHARRSVTTGEQVTLTAVLKDRRGHPVTEQVAWATSDPAIATISDGGVLLARAPGDVRVTATAAGLESVLEMSVAAPAAVEPDPAPLAEPIPPVRPAATARPAPAAPARPDRRGMRVAMIGGGIAAIAIAGLLFSQLGGNSGGSPGEVAADSAPAPAPAPVVAAAADSAASDTLPHPAPGPEPAATAPAAAPAIRSVETDVPSQLGQGDTVTLHAVGRDGDRRPINIRRLRWTSSASAVASVGATTGVLVARGPGSATITATGDGIRHSAAVQVTPKPPPMASATPAAPGPDAAALAGAAVRRAAVDCIAALQRLNADQMERLYLPLTDGDRENASNLVALMRHTEWGLAVSVGAVTLTPRVAGDHAYGDFPAQFTWKTSFGGKREVDVVFRVDAKNAGGPWQAAGCRLQGTPKL